MTLEKECGCLRVIIAQSILLDITLVFILCARWSFAKGKVVWVIWEMYDILIVSLTTSQIQLSIVWFSFQLKEKKPISSLFIDPSHPDF